MASSMSEYRELPSVYVRMVLSPRFVSSGGRAGNPPPPGARRLRTSSTAVSVMAAAICALTVVMPAILATRSAWLALNRFFPRFLMPLTLMQG